MALIDDSAAGEAEITIVRHLHCNGLPLSYGCTPPRFLMQVRGVAMMAESIAGEEEITIVRHLHCNALPLSYGVTPPRLCNVGERGGNDG